MPVIIESSTSIDPVVEAAREYLKRGWAVVPLKPKTKMPAFNGWQSNVYTEDEISTAFAGSNVGVVLGASSGDLVDVDLDCDEARKLAPDYLPPTNAVFGRPSVGNSHRLYVSKGLATARFIDPVTNNTLLELRGGDGKLQTMMPPSIHPAGETVAWDQSGVPSVVDADELSRRAGLLAGASLLSIGAPEKGRHDYLLALTGWLVRVGWTQQEIMDPLLPVGRLIVPDRIKEIAKEISSMAASAVHKLSNGSGKVPGWPAVRHYLRTDRLDALCTWLGIDRDGSVSSGSQTWGPPDFSVLKNPLPPAVPFPLEVLPKPVASWVTDSAKASSCPVDYVAMSLLGVLGALLANSRRPRVTSTFVEPPLLWVVLVGLPGSGKSPGMKVVQRCAAKLIEPEMKAFQKLRDEQINQARMRRLKSKFQDRKYLKALSKGEEDESILASGCAGSSAARSIYPPHFIVADTTGEAITKPLAKQSRALLICRDELAGFIGGMDRYTKGNADVPMFLQAYDGGSYNVTRVKLEEPINVPALSVGIVGGIQPEPLQKLILDQPNNGFCGRLLYVYPNEVEGEIVDVDIDDNIIMDTLRRIWALQPQPSDPGNACWLDVPLGIDARGLADSYRAELSALEKKCHGPIQSWIAKGIGHVVRLAAILAYTDWASGDPSASEPKAITMHHVDRAIRLHRAYLLGFPQPSGHQQRSGARCHPCPEHVPRMRRSSAGRWSSWSGPDGIRRTCLASSNRRRRRSEIGSRSPIGWKAVKRQRRPCPR